MTEIQMVFAVIAPSLRTSAPDPPDSFRAANAARSRLSRRTCAWERSSVQCSATASRRVTVPFIPEHLKDMLSHAALN